MEKNIGRREGEDNMMIIEKETKNPWEQEGKEEVLEGREEA